MRNRRIEIGRDCEDRKNERGFGMKGKQDI